jgi:hypothetical protein
MRGSARWFRVLLCLGFPILLTGCRFESKGPYGGGLAPLDPPLEGYHTVDSVQPLLRWEAFPRSKDREADREGIVGQITEVTYDLKVWETPHRVTSPRVRRGPKGVITDVWEEAPGRFDGELNPIYARTGLTTPSHRIDLPLKPATYYMWTIRAHFLLKGQPRITEWGQEMIWFMHRGQGGFKRDVEHEFFGQYQFITSSGKARSIERQSAP